MIRPAEPVFWTNFTPAQPTAPAVLATPAQIAAPPSAMPAAAAVAPWQRPSLDSIGLRYFSDKASGHHGFLDFYDRFLGELRDTAVAVLEIGVNGGEATRMWEEYFPHARVLGIDSRPECARFVGGRIELGLAEPADMLRLVELATRHGPFDVIIDDWTHMWEHQIGNFRALYPFVRPGGYYILEDIDTSYGDYVPVYRGEARMSTASYLQAMTDLVISGIPVEDEVKDDAFLKSAAPKTEFIAFHNGTALLRRRPA